MIDVACFQAFPTNNEASPTGASHFNPRRDSLAYRPASGKDFKIEGEASGRQFIRPKQMLGRWYVSRKKLEDGVCSRRADSERHANSSFTSYFWNILRHILVSTVTWRMDGGFVRFTYNGYVYPKRLIKGLFSIFACEAWARIQSFIRASSLAEHRDSVWKVPACGRAMTEG